jgi:phosphopantetheinyl transferase (holo-ACP synthase)
MIQMKEMLDLAAQMMVWTDDPKFKDQNKLVDLEKGQVMKISEGKTIQQLQVTPINFALFDNAVKEWELQARTTGSANDAQLGLSPNSGTPFKLQDLIVQQGQGIHEYRRGKIATFFAEIYRDWILPHLVDEMNKGDEWLESLSLEELQFVSESVATKYANKEAVRMVINKKPNEVISQTDIEAFRDKVKQQWMNGGNKKFMVVMKDELKNIPVDVDVNITGKQRDLSKMTDKLVNIFRQIIANPAILQNASMAKIFNQILEYSGLSPVDFAGFQAPVQQQQQPAMAQ